MKIDWLFLTENFHIFWDEERDFASQSEDECDYDVEQEQHEEFSVAEPHTVGNPGAVVVHIEHASLASGAVMAPTLSK